MVNQRSFARSLLYPAEESLLTYAREELGCAGITPVWLSCYVDGCRQELHADVPHGPWAFVLSLTRWDSAEEEGWEDENAGGRERGRRRRRKFTGGETLILKPDVLDYWRGFDAGAVVERGSLVEMVEPRFNRLTVFDPRLPHGVPVVEGTRDPREGRLVLHGWFNDPSPFFSGALTEEDAEPILNEVLPPLYANLAVRVIYEKKTNEDDGGVFKCARAMTKCFFFLFLHSVHFFSHFFWRVG